MSSMTLRKRKHEGDDAGQGSKTKYARRPARTDRFLEKLAVGEKGLKLKQASLQSLPRKGSVTRSYGSPTPATDSVEQAALQAQEKPFSKTWPSSHPVQGHYTEQYQNALNSYILDIQHPGILNESEDVKDIDVQVGGSLWTPYDREVFFEALGRYGRDQVTRIAAIVGKSVPEVSLLLDLLADEAKKLVWLRGSAGGKRIPAALELSKPCLAVTETASDALAYDRFVLEIENEKEKYGENWLLVGETSGSENEADDDDDDEEEESQSASGDNYSLPAKDSGHNADGSMETRIPGDGPLLDLEKLLELSTLVFMNSSDPESDWRTCINTMPIPDGALPGRLEKPAIFKTAFDDLTRLTTFVTQRLIATAQYQAQCRMRATDSIWDPQAPYITVETHDVHAACDILNMKRNAFDHWASFPRRHKVEWAYVRYHKIHNTKIITVSPYAAGECLKDGSKTTQKFNSIIAKVEEEERAKANADTLPSELSSEGFPSRSHSSSENEPMPEEPGPLNMGLDEWGQLLDESDNVSEEGELSSLEEFIGSDPLVMPPYWKLGNRLKKQVKTPTPPASDWGDQDSMSSEEAAEETFELEQLDKVAGEEEERRMWKVLGTEPPEPAPPAMSSSLGL